MRPKKWRPESVEALKILYNAREKIEEIARRLGRTPKAVRNRIHKMGLSNRRYLLDEKFLGEVRAMKAEGRTDKEIAFLLGVHNNTIWNARKRLGITVYAKRPRSKV